MNQNKKQLLKVNEIFGPTIQGEGPNIGTPTMFLRLAICNLKCSFCDTFYTWDFNRVNYKDEVHEMSIEDILEQLDQHDKISHLVISGGEPLLQHHKLVPLIEELFIADWHIEVETAGTIIPKNPIWRLVKFNVSPKLSNSGNPIEKRRNLPALNWFARGNSNFKFVVSNKEDLKEVDEIVALSHIREDSVYLMPEGIDTETLLTRGKWLVQEAVERGYNFTTRMHTLLWGNERGK